MYIQGCIHGNFSGYALKCKHHTASACSRSCGNRGLHSILQLEPEVRRRLLAWEAAGETIHDDAGGKRTHRVLAEPVLAHFV